MIYIVLILAVIGLIFYLRIRKVPKVGNMILTTGGIKTGKSTFSVYMAIRLYKRQVRKYHINRALIKVFRKLGIRKFKEMPLPNEKPLLYSNIPLKVPYTPLTHSLINRNERFVYGSVVYLCEMSLIADSMTFKNDLLNEQLLLFTKLFAHETKGGYLVIDTQSILDNHYAVKRCLSTYLYIHHTLKIIPFFLLMWVKELHYSEDGNMVNINDGDAEDKLKLIIVPKSVWKKFDCYCYSIFTDNLKKVENTEKNVKSLKANNVISFKEYKTIKVKEVSECEQKEK